MRRTCCAAALCAALALSSAAATPGASPPGLSAPERAGREIYHEGTSPSGGAITALVGDAVLPGAALACASCHGADGLGRAEGGVLPLEITWSRLVKPYGHDHGRRRHPAFDERSVARAISDGVDPAGKPLDPAMPRYSMSREDLESLVAYLKVLEREAEPGVSAGAVRIGTALPTRGRLAGVGVAMKTVLDAYFAELNGRGGVHGRTLELAVAEYDPDHERGADALERLLEEEPIFALVSPFTPGSEAEVVALAEQRGIPLVAPLTSAPSDRYSYAFYALAGITEQARALAEHAARSIPAERRRLAVLRARGSYEHAAEAARAQIADRGGHVELREFAAGELAGIALALARDRCDAVLLLGGEGDVTALGAAARAASWAPVLLLPAALFSPATVAALSEFSDVHVAFPSAPGDGTPRGREHLSRLTGKGAVTPGERHAQASAYVGASLLAEGLRGAGRQLRRGTVVARLESLQRFAPGVGPPLSYGPSRRIGARGAHILSPARDGAGFRVSGGWIALD